MFGFIVVIYSIINRLNSVKETFMNRPNSLFRDILIGIFFTSGVLGFMSGEFVLSTVLFGAASVSTNLGLDEIKPL